MAVPVIGITRDHDGHEIDSDTFFIHYATSVEKAGGKPIPVFFRDDLDTLDALLSQLDGIIFSGGSDLDPQYYGEIRHPQAIPLNPRRERFELALIAAAERASMPIFGICLGSQVLNVHRGGSLHQFLPELPRENPLEHRKLEADSRRHQVRVVPDTLLAETVGTLDLCVNTSHKQAVRKLGRGLRVAAHAPDGIVEAIEDVSKPLYLGVQWHPERLSDEPEHLALFKLLVERASCYR